MERGAALQPVLDFRSITGKGVVGTVGGRAVETVGSAALLGEVSAELSKAAEMLRAEGQTVVFEGGSVEVDGRGPYRTERPGCSAYPLHCSVLLARRAIPPMRGWCCMGSRRASRRSTRDSISSKWMRRRSVPRIPFSSGLDSECPPISHSRNHRRAAAALSRIASSSMRLF